VLFVKITELKAGASNVSVQAKVIKKDDPREVITKFGKRLSVANITLEDDTGTIAMSLWGNDISKVGLGDTIEVSNAYVSEFRGSPQLSTGKFGKIEVIEKGSGEAGAGEDEGEASEPEE
jgi:ssDNA-binding replication factor A large subunit